MKLQDSAPADLQAVQPCPFPWSPLHRILRLRQRAHLSKLAFEVTTGFLILQQQQYGDVEEPHSCRSRPSRMNCGWDAPWDRPYDCRGWVPKAFELVDCEGRDNKDAVPPYEEAHA
jgi:hypothetical protein